MEPILWHLREHQGNADQRCGTHSLDTMCSMPPSWVRWIAFDFRIVSDTILGVNEGHASRQHPRRGPRCSHDSGHYSIKSHNTEEPTNGLDSDCHYDSTATIEITGLPKRPIYTRPSLGPNGQPWTRL